MIARGALGAFACGLVIGVTLAMIAFMIVARDSGSAEKLDYLDPESLPRARARVEEFESPVLLHVQTDATIDPLAAVSLGTTDSERGAERLETQGGLVAFRAWEGNGFTGSAATFCFGPEPRDVRVRVVSFGDMGPSETRWFNVSGSVQLSAWPPDRAGTRIAFFLEGQTDHSSRLFTGKVLVP